MSKEQKTEFLYMIPVFASADVQRDVDWYEGKLGFKNIYDSSNYQQGPLDYAVLERQGQILHLQFQFPADMTSTDVKIEVRNIAPIYEEFLNSGVARPKSLILKTPWGTSEFGLFDLSGNRITFIEDI
jgi:catechol 2,3-dioxygenase-like lactoylglutathione lyase family enzyme